MEKFSKNSHFLIILVLFAAFSMYAIASFFDSTDNYINSFYTSVTGSDLETVVPVDQVFTDVYLDHVNAEAIRALYEEGIVSGYDGGDFRPGDTINRAELVKIVTAAVDADFGGMALGDCFNDVSDEWFAVFVCYSKDNDWVSGYEDTSYKPSQTITKAEALKIVFEAFSYPVCDPVVTQPYADVELTAWYAPYACAAKADGIIPRAGLFNAANEITRAEFVQMVYNVMIGSGKASR